MTLRVRRSVLPVCFNAVLIAKIVKTGRPFSAFSPGEYLGTASVTGAAKQLKMPIFVTSASNSAEIAEARAILAASPGTDKVQFVPKSGVHGASTLREDTNRAGSAENWAAVEAFLSRFK